MAYELWDRENANVIAVFDSETLALALVRRELTRQESHILATWALAYEDDEGETHALAAGAELIRRALGDPQRVRTG